MERSCFTIDLGAVRRNAATLARAAEGAELWAVVKAEGYGHGAVDVSRAALEGGATALCVATVPEALHLRTALRGARVIVMGPVSEHEVPRGASGASSRSSRRTAACPRACPCISSSTPAWGAGGCRSCRRRRGTSSRVMSHLASAESDEAFSRVQIERFRAATDALGGV